VKRPITIVRTRHAVSLLLLMALPCLAADWQITVKVERPGSSHADSLKAHFIQHDDVQEDVWAILKYGHGAPCPYGWMIVDNNKGTQYVVTVPDTIPVVGPIRSALGKYNQRVMVRKEKIKPLEP